MLTISNGQSHCNGFACSAHCDSHSTTHKVSVLSTVQGFQGSLPGWKEQYSHWTQKVRLNRQRSQRSQAGKQRSLVRNLCLVIQVPLSRQKVGWKENVSTVPAEPNSTCFFSRPTQNFTIFQKTDATEVYYYIGELEGWCNFPNI